MSEKKVIHADDLFLALRDDINIPGACLARVKRHIDAAPAADAIPVIHGRWITRNKGQNNWAECSECDTVGSPFWKCCPVCVAMMDGGDDNE